MRFLLLLLSLLISNESLSESARQEITVLLNCGDYEALSFVKRELRSLGDIIVEDYSGEALINSNYDFILRVTTHELKNNRDQLFGYSVGFILTEPFIKKEPILFSSISESFQKDTESFQKLDAVADSTEFQKQLLSMVGSGMLLNMIADKEIYSFDSSSYGPVLRDVIEGMVMRLDNYSFYIKRELNKDNE